MDSRYTRTDAPLGNYNVDNHQTFVVQGHPIQKHGSESPSATFLQESSEYIEKSKKAANLLAQIRHSFKCKGSCRNPPCMHTSSILAHLRYCPNPNNCSVPGCTTTRKLIEHARTCSRNVLMGACLICSLAAKQKNVGSMASTSNISGLPPPSSSSSTTIYNNAASSSLYPPPPSATSSFPYSMEQHAPYGQQVPPPPPSPNSLTTPPPPHPSFSAPSSPFPLRFEELLKRRQAEDSPRSAMKGDGEDGDGSDSSVKRPRRNTIDSGRMLSPIDSFKKSPTLTTLAYSLDAFSSNLYFPTYVDRHDIEYCEVDASLQHNYAVSWDRRPSQESIDFNQSKGEEDMMKEIDPMST